MRHSLVLLGSMSKCQRLRLDNGVWCGCLTTGMTDEDGCTGCEHNWICGCYQVDGAMLRYLFVS